MPGDIAIFKRYDKAGKLVGGHVAFVVDRYKDAKGDYQVIILGGNQSNSVSVASRPEKDLIEYRRVPPEDAKKLAAAVGAYEEKIKTDPHLQKIAENKIQVVEKARMSKKVEAAVL